MNARLTWNHMFGDIYHYMTGSIGFANPLAGIDQLLHGSSNLRGWGPAGVARSNYTLFRPRLRSERPIASSTT